MGKTWGQIAYEAYCAVTDWKSLVSGAALPQWDDVRSEIKEAWEKSGQVVAGQAASEFQDSILKYQENGMNYAEALSRAEKALAAKSG